MELVFYMRNWVMKYSHILVKPFVPVKVQESLIKSFPEPDNIIDRAYYQYKATMEEWTWIGKITAEMTALFLFPIYSYFLTHKQINFEEQKNLICLVASDQKDIIPITLKEEFQSFQYGDVSDQMCIDNRDWKYLKSIYKRFKGSYYFKLKILFRVAAYSAFIKRYHPRAFVSAAEHSFSNTLCTDYCEFKKVENIVCQHGEYLKKLRGSFFYVHRYYVWDKYYVRLHREYRAYIPRYYVYMPKVISDLKIKSKKKASYFATYYLEYENKTELLSIRKCLDCLKEKGHMCKLRLHPRGKIYNKNIVSNIFGRDYYVEDNTQISLGESISDSEYLISACSTVLLQGYLIGKKIIIDDISKKKLYKNLQERGYVMLSKPHHLLSDIVAENHWEGENIAT